MSEAGRCPWCVPVHDDRRHFEFLILEGAQAGLSWLTVLKRREGYREAFAGFDPVEVARFDEVPVFTPEAEAASRDLKSRGFKFVGPTIIYAHMQAAGLVNDHLVSCFRHAITTRAPEGGGAPG